MTDFKFDVGQFVMLKVDENPLGEDRHSAYHIIERHLQECPAGNQVWYTCRGHHRKYKERVVTLQLVKFNEIELEECKPVEQKDLNLKQKVVELLDQIAKGEEKPME